MRGGGHGKKLFCAVLVAVLFLPIKATPTGAQDGPESVIITFRLTLYGEVPRNNSFEVVFGESPYASVGEVVLCGPPRAERCRGGGAVYTEDVTVRRGAEFGYDFKRRAAGLPDGQETFVNPPTTKVTEDETFAAYYSFAEADGGQDVQDGQEGGDEQVEDGQAVPNLPDTGGGGLCGAATRCSPLAGRR